MGLVGDEVDEWWAVVNRMPADWFGRETQALLAQYCRAVSRAKRISWLIHKVETDEAGFNLGLHLDLLKAEQGCARTVAMLATKMRLAQQSTYDKSAKKPTLMASPWDDDGE